MALADHVAPWSGAAYRHVPDGSPFGVLDFRFAAVASDNRWNAAGEPTLYLAGDPAVAAAELWRHVDANFRPSVVGAPLRRRLYRLELRLPAVLDLCAPGAWAALDLPNAPHCFLDKEIARAVARYARVALPVGALRVPSVAFLDDLTRYSLVVFLDKLPVDPATWIDRVSDEGTLSFEP
jgi:hypothetical protein